MASLASACAVRPQCDLVPKPALDRWMAHLNEQLPTLPFCAAPEHKPDSSSSKADAKAAAAAAAATRAATAAATAAISTLLAARKKVLAAAGKAPEVLSVGVIGFDRVGARSHTRPLRLRSPSPRARTRAFRPSPRAPSP